MNKIQSSIFSGSRCVCVCRQSNIAGNFYRNSKSNDDGDSKYTNETTEWETDRSNCIAEHETTRFQREIGDNTSGATVDDICEIKCLGALGARKKFENRNACRLHWSRAHNIVIPIHFEFICLSSRPLPSLCEHHVNRIELLLLFENVNPMCCALHRDNTLIRTWASA